MLSSVRAVDLHYTTALIHRLDLVYLTDQVIIMGYPASGVEGWYRNPREDVKKFLGMYPTARWALDLIIRAQNTDTGRTTGYSTSAPSARTHTMPHTLITASADSPSPTISM